MALETKSDGMVPTRLRAACVGFGAFAAYVGERFLRDECQTRAAALTFTALLAVVPLIAISFAIFAAFPAFARLQEDVQAFVFQNFVPEIGSVVLDYVQGFAAKTGQLTVVGVLFLIVTSVMLLSTISKAFNAVWGVKPRRSLVARLLVFWAVLTLAPLFFGASLTLSSYLFAIAQATGVETLAGPVGGVAGLAPLVLQVAGFSLLYLVMPDYPVRRRDALIGGLLAGVLFEVLKKGFAWYVATFPTYQTIYGALAVFPIFLIWVYLSWLVVMLGAVVTASLPDWRGGLARTRRHGAPSDKLSAALAVLNVLARAAREGRVIKPAALIEAARVGPDSLIPVTDTLARKGYIARTDKGAWVLMRDLSGVVLYRLVDDLGLRLTPAIARDAFRGNWGPRFTQMAAEADKAAGEAMSMPLSELLAPRDGASEGEPLEYEAPEDEEGDGAGDPDKKAPFAGRALGLLGLGWLVTKAG